MNYRKALMTCGIIATVGWTQPTFAADRNNDNEDRRSRNRERITQNNDRTQQIGRALPANRLIGRNVETQDGKHIGELRDLVVALESGRVLYAVVDREGSGNQNRVALPASLFTFERSDAGGGDRNRRNRDRDRDRHEPGAKLARSCQ
jgi:hypothetical protein